MLVRETLVIHSRLSWRQVRGVAAIERQHGLQALAIEHLAARLAGGFLQPINSASLKEAIGEAIGMDLGEFNDIKTLPGFPRAAAATLQKAWAAGLKFTELAKTSDALARSRIDAVTRLEAEVLKRLPPSMRRPADLVALALPHLRHAKTLFGAIRVLGRTEMSPIWRPFLAALKDVTDVQWVAGPRQVPAWARALGIAVVETPPERPEIQSESCASPRHEALEATRWARALLASGRAKPEEIAIAAASPAEWDDHFQALSEMAGIDLHFVHGRKALSTPEGQLAAALAEVLLRGFSQARMTRLIASLRSQNPDFKIVPGNWWRALPEDAPLLDAASWRDVPAPRDTPATPTTQNQSYPCRTCKSTTPFFYCTPCRAEYEKREAEEDAKRKAKQPRINAAQRAWYAERKNRYATTKSCAACGKNFKPKRKDARFCSNACRQAMHRAKHARSAAS